MFSDLRRSRLQPDRVSHQLPHRRTVPQVAPAQEAAVTHQGSYAAIRDESARVTGVRRLIQHFPAGHGWVRGTGTQRNESVRRCVISFLHIFHLYVFLKTSESSKTQTLKGIALFQFVQRQSLVSIFTLLWMSCLAIDWV